MEFETTIKLPANLSFSFERYLKTIGQNLLGEISPQKQPDNSLKLLALLTDFHAELLSLFEIENQETTTNQTKKIKKGEGALDMDCEIYSIQKLSANSKYELTLSRDINGHMGYYEDYLKAKFEFENKSIYLNADLFLNQNLSIQTKELSETKFDQLIVKLKEQRH